MIYVCMLPFPNYQAPYAADLSTTGPVFFAYYNSFLKRHDQPQYSAHICLCLTIASAIFQTTKMAAFASQRKPGKSSEVELAHLFVPFFFVRMLGKCLEACTPYFFISLIFYLKFNFWKCINIMKKLRL